MLDGLACPLMLVVGAEDSNPSPDDAEVLRQELVREARRRIRTLLDNGRLDLRYAERWQLLLARPIPEIAKTISSDTQRARDLRQNTPFAGVLNEQERRQIIENVR